MGAHTAGPEDTDEQENGADNLADTTHTPKAIPMTRLQGGRERTGASLVRRPVCLRRTPRAKILGAHSNGALVATGDR
jgi:hypothetical protein